MFCRKILPFYLLLVSCFTTNTMHQPSLASKNNSPTYDPRVPDLKCGKSIPQRAPLKKRALQEILIPEQLNSTEGITAPTKKAKLDSSSILNKIIGNTFHKSFIAEELPLCSAVQAGDENKVARLIAQGADCNASQTQFACHRNTQHYLTYSRGLTPLHWAAHLSKENNISIAQRLLDAHALINAGCSNSLQTKTTITFVDNITPLTIALVCQNTLFARFLVSKNAHLITPLKITTHEPISGAIAHAQYTPMQLAEIYCGKDEYLKKYIETTIRQNQLGQ